MSIVVGAIYNNKEVFLASDSKISSLSGTKKYSNYNKIAKISDNVALGITGSFLFGKKI